VTALSIRNRWDEKRRYPRVALKLPVGIAVVPRGFHFPPSKPTGRGLVRDASVGTCGIESETAIAAGEDIKLWLPADTERGEGKIVLRGTVLWSEQPERDGPCYAGILLDERPKQSMQTWHDMVVRLLRAH